LHYKSLRFPKGRAKQPAELFEFLSGQAIKSYLKGDILRLGATRRSPVPKGFKEAVRFMATQLGESFGDTYLMSGHEKDDGLDLTAWIPFADERPGKLILLMQCAIGTDWREKLSELNLDLWKQHVRWDVTPIRAFAVPFQHEDGVKWNRNSTVAGIIFDRLRIAQLASCSSPPNELIENIKGWCRERINELDSVAYT